MNAFLLHTHLRLRDWQEQAWSRIFIIKMKVSVSEPDRKMLIHTNKSQDFIKAEPTHIFIKTWTSMNFVSDLIILIKLLSNSDNACPKNTKYFHGTTFH